MKIWLVYTILKISGLSVIAIDNEVNIMHAKLDLKDYVLNE